MAHTYNAKGLPFQHVKKHLFIDKPTYLWIGHRKWSKTSEIAGDITNLNKKMARFLPEIEKKETKKLKRLQILRGSMNEMHPYNQSRQSQGCSRRGNVFTSKCNCI